MDLKYVGYLLLCALVCWFIVYKTAEAGILDWFTIDSQPSIVNVIPVKTLDSEIDRLSLKYEVNKELATKIIYCESRNVPTAIRVNTTGTIDYSYWQINDFYWKSEMDNLGWDITNPEDNLEAGFYLLSKYGDKLWNWSKYCWIK